MAFLTIEQIANADDLPTKVIPVPAWGGDIEIRMLTKAEQDTVRREAVVDGVIDEMRVELGILAKAIVKPELGIEHIQMLSQKNADVVDDILAEVFSMNAISKEAVAHQRAEFHQGSDEVAGVPHSGEAGDDQAADAAGDAV